MLSSQPMVINSMARVLTPQEVATRQGVLVAARPLVRNSMACVSVAPVKAERMTITVPDDAGPGAIVSCKLRSGESVQAVLPQGAVPGALMDLRQNAAGAWILVGGGPPLVGAVPDELPAAADTPSLELGDFDGLWLKRGGETEVLIMCQNGQWSNYGEEAANAIQASDDGNWTTNGWDLDREKSSRDFVVWRNKKLERTWERQFDDGPKIWNSRFPNVEIPDVTLHRLLFDTFEQDLDKVLFIDGITGEEWTRAKLLNLAKSVAAGLTAAGVVQGDVVAVYLPNTPLYFSIVFGALLAGVSATLINPTYQDFELENAMNITEPKVWFTLASFVKNVTDASEKTGIPQAVVVIDAEPPAGTISFIDFVKPDGYFVEATDTDAVALLCYSSGTTGLPKAVALTHKNVVSNLHQLTSQPDHFLGFTENTVLLAVLPFFHIYGGIMYLLSAPYTGVCTVSMPKFDPVKYLENLKKYRVTVAHVAPPIVQFLLKHPMVAQAMPFDDLKEVVCAAAPLAPEPADELKNKLNLDVIRQGYGMTELSPVVCMGDRLNSKPGAVGLLLPNQEMLLIGDDGKPVTERNQRGEVLIRGPNVMAGYYKNQEATDGCIDGDGFMHTGDVAYVDDDDQLWIVDRTKELIKVKGYQVAPAELEGLLLTHPKVADAAVIGVAAGFDYGGREGDGQLPKAFVVKKDDTLTEDEVKEFVAKDLVEYKKLAAVEFIDAVPKSASGKILRKDLRKREEDAGRKVFA